MALSPCTQLPASQLQANIRPPDSVDLGNASTQELLQIFQTPEAMLQKVALLTADLEAKRVLGWARLKEFQKRAVRAWAVGKNCFLISGTGSGKTGCFVIPSLVARAWHRQCGAKEPAPLALVVSPLVALMRDQVRRLRERGVEAEVCSPQCGNCTQIWDNAKSGRLEVLYISPELLHRKWQLNELQQLPRVSLFAIDEAHCVSEWGFHFRPEYGQLRDVMSGIMQAGYGGRPPPVICVTATCTAEVRSHVLLSLKLDVRLTEEVVGTMNRPNLHFAVEELPSLDRMQQRLLELFDAVSLDAADARRARGFDTTTVNAYSLSIVYVTRIIDCELLATLLKDRGVRAAAFHSKMKTKTSIKSRRCSNEMNYRL
jgi:ATP-dependent DNA helicase RecQ